MAMNRTGAMGPAASRAALSFCLSVAQSYQEIVQAHSGPR